MVYKLTKESDIAKDSILISPADANEVPAFLHIYLDKLPEDCEELVVLLDSPTKSLLDVELAECDPDEDKDLESYLECDNGEVEILDIENMDIPDLDLSCLNIVRKYPHNTDEEKLDETVEELVDTVSKEEKEEPVESPDHPVEPEVVVDDKKDDIQRIEVDVLATCNIEAIDFDVKIERDENGEPTVSAISKAIVCSDLDFKIVDVRNCNEESDVKEGCDECSDESYDDGDVCEEESPVEPQEEPVENKPKRRKYAPRNGMRTKCARTTGHLVKQIPTPTCTGDIVPTFVATGYNEVNYKYMYSVGHYPKIGLVEVWEDDCEDGLTVQEDRMSVDPKGRPEKLITTDVNSGENIKESFTYNGSVKNPPLF